MSRIFYTASFLILACSYCQAQTDLNCPNEVQSQSIRNIIQSIFPADRYKNSISEYNNLQNQIKIKRAQYDNCQEKNSDIINSLASLGMACTTLANSYNNLVDQRDSVLADFNFRTETLKKYIATVREGYPQCRSLNKFLQDYNNQQ